METLNIGSRTLMEMGTLKKILKMTLSLKLIQIVQEMETQAESLMA